MSDDCSAWWSDLIKRSAIEGATSEYLAWCEIERLTAELNEAAEATGIAGVDEPMSLLECIQSLTAELAKWQEQAEVNKHDAHNFHDIVVQKDKRIEELLEAEIEPIVGVFRNGHLVTYKQINAAWADAWGKYRGTDSTAGFSSLEKVGIVACEECGGGVSKAWDNGCPSCHGHGWVSK